MVLAQSAASAADVALDQAIKVQDVPYTVLRERLDADRQIVQLEGKEPFGAKHRKQN